jgi:hypothetical protein
VRGDGESSMIEVTDEPERSAARMRLTGVAMVKNEADIIEAFVRHNLRYLDRLVLIDHASTDATPRILEALRDEGLPLAIERETALAFDQARRLSFAAHRAAAHADFVFALDADEFIRADGRDGLERALARVDAEAVVVPWQTYVPQASNVDSIHPFERALERARREPLPESKVVLSGLLARGPGWQLTPGNHGVARNRDGAWQALATPELPGVALAHLPCRSADQLVKKIVLGWFGHRLLLGTQADSTPMGWHWRELYRRFRDHGAPGPGELRELTLRTYVLKRKPDDDRPIEVELVRDPIALPMPLPHTPPASDAALRALLPWTDGLLDQLLARGRR